MRPRLSLFAVRVVNYVTNDLVSRVPSFALRHAWYRTLGIRLGPGSGMHRGCYIWFYGARSLRSTGISIGANTRINRNCCLDARGSLRIGDNVSISPEVAILTTQHDWRAPDFALESRPVVIEDNVWIGMRAMILPGTQVGRGAVIAAGAVASGSIPALAVVAGVPARTVAQRPPEATGYLLDQPFPLFE